MTRRDMMTYQLEDYKTYIKKLKKIQEIDWVNFQLSLNERPNFWSIIEYGDKIKKNKRSSHEERMSEMIRWLLDPNETHQLGNIFAVRFLELFGKTYAYSPHKNKQINVETEYEQIDVLYRDYETKVFFAIELKQYSLEGIRNDGRSQLDDYDDVLHSIAEKDTEIVRIYLTPLKEKAT